MDCPACSESTRVIDSRPRPNGAVRRRRQCETCGLRFTTHERKVAEHVLAQREDRDAVPV